MAEAATKLPIKTDAAPVAQPARAADWQPFEALRNQVDRLFRDFQTGFPQAPSYRSLLDMEPFWRRDSGLNVAPALDIVEKDRAFEVTAELPGLDAKNIDLQLSDDMLTIKGEKQEEKEEKTKDRYISERRYGSFRRSLQVPGSVDAGKIEANFKNGLLTITLPSLAASRSMRRGLQYCGVTIIQRIDLEMRPMAHKQILFTAGAADGG